MEFRTSSHLNHGTRKRNARDLAGTFATAKSDGYHGYFSMEYEGKEEIHSATTKLIDQSVKYI